MNALNDEINGSWQPAAQKTKNKLNQQVVADVVVGVFVFLCCGCVLVFKLDLLVYYCHLIN